MEDSKVDNKDCNSTGSSNTDDNNMDSSKVDNTGCTQDPHKFLCHDGELHSLPSLPRFSASVLAVVLALDALDVLACLVSASDVGG